MKSLLILLALLVMIGQSQASTLPTIKTVNEIEKELKEASINKQAEYAECIMESVTKDEREACINEVLGDIYN